MYKLMLLHLLLVMVWVNSPTVLSQFPGLQEQAVIVAYGENLSTNEMFPNATKLSLVCVTFGRPLPKVTWKSYDQVINFAANSSTLNMYNFEIKSGKDFTYIVSVLELCNITDISPYTCTTSNGVTSVPPLGVSSVNFFTFNAENDTTTELVTPMYTTLITSVSGDSSADQGNMNESDSRTLVVAMTVLVCIVALSIGLVVASIVTVCGLRRSRSRQNGGASPIETVQYIARGHTESEVSRIYNNSLYGKEVERQQTRNPEQLYVCQAYEGVVTLNQYEYIDPPSEDSQQKAGATGEACEQCLK